VILPGSEPGIDPGDEVVSLECSADAIELATIRGALRGWLLNRSIVGAKADDLLIVLNEIASNAVDASPPHATMTARWWVEGEHIVLSVDDSGSGFEYHHTEPVGPTSLRGRGLNVVEALSDRLQVTADGHRTTVTAWTAVEGPVA